MTLLFLRKVDEDVYTRIIHEDENNRFVDQLLKQRIINQAISDQLKTNGSRPRVLYGLPKIHKKGTPMRPILSTIGSFNYMMCKWLVPMVSHLCSNEFVVRDSFTFAKFISGFENRDYVMASFDVTSLFTNIPIKETCNIILDKCFPNSTSTFNGFTRDLFSKVLKNCTSNNLFIFNEELYLLVLQMGNGKLP